MACCTAYQVLPTLITLIPSGLVFHKYGSMCTCKFLLPRWHCAERSISMSCAVALKPAGRLEGAIFAEGGGEGVRAKGGLSWC